MPGEAHVIFYGLFEWKKSAGHVLRKIVSHTTVEPPLFPCALLRTIFYEPDRGPERQEK